MCMLFTQNNQNHTFLFFSKTATLMQITPSSSRLIQVCNLPSFDPYQYLHSSTPVVEKQSRTSHTASYTHYFLPGTPIDDLPPLTRRPCESVTTYPLSRTLRPPSRYPSRLKVRSHPQGLRDC